MSRFHLSLNRLLVLLAVFVPACFQPLCSADEGMLLGFTQPNLTIEVAFSQPGRVKTLHVKEGQKVAKNALLAALDEGSLPLTLSIAQVRSDDDSAIQSAHAKSEALAARLAELKRLQTSGGASPEETRRVATELDVARANESQAESERAIQHLEVKRLELERDLHHLKAPFDSYVTEIHKRPGEYVSTSAPEVMELVQLDPLKIHFHVPVLKAAKMKVGENVKLRIQTESKSVSASIRRISRVVDPQSGTTLVELELPNQDLVHQSGLKCQWDLSTVAHSHPRKGSNRSKENQ